MQVIATLSAIAKNNKNKNFVRYLWSRFNSTMRLTIRYNKSTMLEKSSKERMIFIQRSYSHWALYSIAIHCLHCFESDGWAEGRVSGL